MKKLIAAMAIVAVAAPAVAQNETPWTPLKPGSDNITVESHVPLGSMFSVTDIDMEQEMSRPYVYVSRGTLGESIERGTDIFDISDPSNPHIIARWRIEDQELHTGLGAMDVKHFKWNGRYYVVQSLQFGNGPNSDLGAVILDVTGLPDGDSVREVARIREPELPGGFHNIFIYKHSNGRVLLLTTVNGGAAHAYDMGRAVEGDVENALVGTIPVPEDASGGPIPFLFYHDLYAAWHPDTEQDRFYGGGTGGYYIFDITDIENPTLQISLTGITGVAWGHTFTPSPDGRYAVGETEYQYAPLRIFDMKPALDGETTNIRRPISAWTANWKNLVHNHEMRWPYVFVSGYHDGLQIFSLMDPENPKTVGYYDTYTGPRDIGVMGGAVGNGAFGVDVRNADGLIVISDMSTGLWIFRMEGFNGWNGEDWGQPDISSVQKWEDPPAGTTDPTSPHRLSEDMKRTFLAIAALVLVTMPARGQWTPEKPGSDNMEVLGHIPLGPILSVADVDIEQEMDRPYAYVARMVYGWEGPKGMDIVSIADPSSPEVIYEWRIEDQDLHQRTGGMDVKHFKWNGRYYVVQSLQFGGGGPDNDLGAVVLDVTGLPDPDQVREVGRIRDTDHPGGFHNIFVYKHTSGRVLLFSTVSGPYAHVYDLGMVVEGRADEALVGRVPNPQEGRRGYHDFYVGYHTDTGQDRFYGGGTGGYYVYNVTDLENPELLVTLTGISGVRSGHTFTPGPNGRYVIAETEYRHAPLRIFDLQPALEGETTNISQPISAWTADWQNLVHNHEVRWPYVFVSGYLDGLQVFSMMDPENPTTVGYYDTYLGGRVEGRTGEFNGAFGIDVRNEDGLIVISDMSTGFWTFRMEGFNGWKGGIGAFPTSPAPRNGMIRLRARTD